jgi:hypothetical protein
MKNLKGILVGGPIPTKEEFLETGQLVTQLKDKVIAVRDIGDTGIAGLRALVQSCEDTLEEQEVTKQRKILDESKPWDGAWIGKFFVENEALCKKISMMHLGKDDNSVARAFSNQSLFWLVHKVGDYKFNELYSGRSGRTPKTELI